ncbi:threonine aldolase family protein [Anaerocolumna aminovalerica]|uniref:threonine aldolase family protein n=1 Tax=Anaerocolumna aminovalerica TaxID=1527 RepID=UPI000BE47D2F|nr:low specificity L-threonine aldolase [Anaerocolumna aminovalerica]
MYSFMNDYSEGAHPRILELLSKSNYEQNTGYGEDIHSNKAKDYIKKHLRNENVDIHFIPGGTQTNLLVISSFLRPHQCIIAAETGHVNVHETGAIEATGHKVVTVPSKDGKVTPSAIEQVLNYHTDEHMVQPKMVYISNSTELGTIYKKEELSALHQICKSKGLLLFLDGARIGSALTSKPNNLELPDIAGLVDVFYIGGTKNGALLGEALVICNQKLKEDFRYLIKQRGALMAKGFVTGIQFEALFQDNLFFELGSHANEMADKIALILKECGYSFYTEPCTNQLFPILPNSLLEKLSKGFLFSIQFKADDQNTVVRFVTSWATTLESVDALSNFFIKNSK